MSESAKNKHYMPIIAASYALVALALAIKGQLPTNGIGISIFIGAGFGLMILPLIAIRFRSNSAGWIIFALIGFFYSVGTLGSLGNEQTATPSAPFLYQAKNCEFAVTFPSKPTIKIYTLPQVGDYEEALWTGMVTEDSTALRTECIPIQIGIDESSAKDFLLGQLAMFTKNNGFTSVEYKYNLEAAGPTGYARGIKYIQDKPVTYRITVVAGKNSLITLYAGGLSATYPQREIGPFLDSVRRAN